MCGRGSPGREGGSSKTEGRSWSWLHTVALAAVPCGPPRFTATACLTSPPASSGSFPQGFPWLGRPSVQLYRPQHVLFFAKSIRIGLESIGEAAGAADSPLTNEVIK